MPEGPEVHTLAKAINFYFNEIKSSESVVSHGKHLMLINAKEDWSFGLNGTVYIDSNNRLTKVNSGYIPGEVVKFDYTNEVINSGVDWINCSKADIEDAINTHFVKSKKMLGPLLLDQSIIAGIGVAWGSEILHKANLLPNVKAYLQDLSKLADIMFTIGSEIRTIYGFHLLEMSTVELKDFINRWFTNLYEIRQMKVYKKGTQVTVGGRKWWISNGVATVKSEMTAKSDKVVAIKSTSIDVIDKKSKLNDIKIELIEDE